MKIHFKKSYLTMLRYAVLTIFICGLAYQVYLNLKEQLPNITHPQTSYFDPIGNDFISNYNKKFEAMRPYLRPNSVMGYFSEPGESYVYWGMHICLTEYNIAPAAIIDKKDCDTILYNLYNTQHITTATDRHLQRGWKVLKDFNNGLILLIRK